MDASGQVYAAGHTRSEDFPPYTSGTFYTNFVTKLDQTGSNLIYTFLHNTITPSPAYVALDGAGGVYVAATVDTPETLVVMKLDDAALLGDLNCDGAVDGLDVDAFVMALTDAGTYRDEFPGCDPMLADTNGDGYVDGLDIDPFVSLLSGN